MNFKRFVGLACLLTLVILGVLPAIIQAQPAAPPPEAVIQPTLQLTIPPPQIRTWQEMEAAAALEAAGPPRPSFVKPFRPTIDDNSYKQLKTQAAQNKALPAPAAPGVESAAPLAPTTLTFTVNFDGVNQSQAGGSYPPDTHGAVGPNHFVEITNEHVDIYLKAAPNTLVKSVSLNSFFGYTKPTWPNPQSMFDPRVIYDSAAQRWIVSADAFAESTTVQRFFFAVSQTADPTGAFFIYNVNVITNVSDNGGLWDFPQLGMDQNAVIFTANFFNKAGFFTGARMFTMAKDLLYNGPGTTLNPTVFTGLTGTLAPPIVLDANPNTYLISADSGINVNTMTIYTLTNTAANPPTLNSTNPDHITVPTYSFPANAPQPGTSDLIDTSDARFVNASTQIGNSLFQVHSIASGGFARCRFYEFDTVNKTVIQHGDFGRSSTSFDFNASIAANRHKDVFVTWSATDPTDNPPAFAEVRFSGRLHTDAAGVIPSPGSLLFASLTNLTGNSVNPPSDTTQRWGDYSAVSLDPADSTGLTAWIVNEKIVDASTWGSQIGRIRLPLKSNLPAVNLLLLGD